jgi:hypothetical protein
MADSAGRLQAIEAAIAAELERQARAGTPRIDVAAMARAIDDALTLAPDGEGHRPEELNATNDD